MPKSIAAENMIKDHDIVTEINDRSTVNMTVDFINKIIMNSKVINLTIDRQDALGPKSVTVHRYNLQLSCKNGLSRMRQNCTRSLG